MSDLTFSEIIGRFRKVREDLQKAYFRYLERYKTGWKSRVARRKGWLQDAIDFREALKAKNFRNELSTAKDARVTYSDIYERGLRKKSRNYPGRYALGKAIETEDQFIDADIDRLVDGNLR